MTDLGDRMVTDYLARLEREVADLPAPRRQELLADITEHIRDARAELDPETPEDVSAILTNLGDPAVVGEAAGAELGLPQSGLPGLGLSGSGLSGLGLPQPGPPGLGLPGLGLPEAGPQARAPEPPGRGLWPKLLIGAGVAMAAFVLLACAGAFFFQSSSGPAEQQMVTPVPATTTP